MLPKHFAELTPEDVAEITRLEACMWRAETRFDLAFQEAHFSADFMEFGRSGREYNREQIIRTESSPIAATFPLPDLRVRALDVNTILVTYNSAVDYGGVTQHARRSSIWSRTHTGWAMRFHQGTPFEMFA